MVNEINNVPSHNGESTGDVAIGNENNGKDQLVSFQIVQDIYNELTGNSEELNQGYNIPYQVTFNDVKQLNIQIKQLYEQYNIHSSNESVTVYFDKKIKHVFSSFDRFELYDRTLLEHTESILLKYNLLIILPKTKRPQTYSISVRIGSKIAILKKLEEDSLMRSEYLKLLIGRNAQIAIEYVDYSVARNFKDTIENWFQSLDSNKLPKIIETLQNNSHFFPVLTKYAIGIFSGYLVYKYSSFLVPLESNDLNNLFIALLSSFGFIFISFSISSFFGKMAERNIDSITELSYIQLNRGDEKLIEKFKSTNRWGILKVIIWLAGTFALGVLSSLTATYINAGS